MISLLIGFVLDLVIGDPQNLFHPVRLMGKYIYMFEKKVFEKQRDDKFLFYMGIVLNISLLLISFFIPFILLSIASKINFIFRIILEGIFCYFILATKSLNDESMKVYRSLQQKNIILARKNLSYIVGRDTDNLDEEEIAKATIETVAENTCDGVIAPIFFIIIGGAPLGFLYKAVNTLDSMVGYKNEKYFYFGKFSAIIDDIFNFIPAYIASFFMILSSFILGYDYKNAWYIFKRDKKNHNSPNSAKTESVCAGALNICLGGDSYYKNILVKKKTIGDKNKNADKEDIIKSIKLMYMTAVLTILTSIILK